MNNNYYTLSSLKQEFDKQETPQVSLVNNKDQFNVFFRNFEKENKDLIEKVYDRLHY